MPRAYLAFTADTYKPALWLALVNLSNVSVIYLGLDLVKSIRTKLKQLNKMNYPIADCKVQIFLFFL